MFWCKKNNSHQTPQVELPQTVQEPANPLYLFTFTHIQTHISGISIEPVLVNEEISQKVHYIFEGINKYYPKETENFWRHAFIYHHDLPSSVSLNATRERCYQNPEELGAFIDAVREYKRATLTQENLRERLDYLKEAKKALLLKVIG